MTGGSWLRTMSYMSDKGKLVRDKIPHIVVADGSGREISVRRLSDKEYASALVDKLYEEVCELVAATDAESIVEEAADVLEVLRAIVEAAGSSRLELLKAADHKRVEKGGFKDRMFMRILSEPPVAVEQQGV